MAATTDMPGPASYDVDFINKPANIAKQTDKRWKYIKEAKPGPADYELSPMYQDTLLKGTFNATLNNPLLLKHQQKPASVSDPALNKNTFSINNQPIKVV